MPVIRFATICYAAIGLLGSAAIADALAASATPAGPAVIMHKDLSYTVAKTIAETVIAACAAKSYPVAAVVVDRDGETLIAMRGDEAVPLTMENARRKAYTAMTFKQTTADYAKKLNDGNPVVRQQITLPGVIAIPGGVPIRSGDAVIGAVGASGSPGFDDDCVAAGLDAVKDQLQ
jgi:uncharacterized protein GlcG (DUF336 family)